MFADTSPREVSTYSHDDDVVIFTADDGFAITFTVAAPAGVVPARPA